MKKILSVNEDNDENLCAYYDEEDCRFAYVYYYKDDKVEIRAQKERECPPKVRKTCTVILFIRNNYCRKRRE